MAKSIEQTANLITENNNCLPQTNYINFGEICKNNYPEADRLRFLTFAIPVPYCAKIE